MKKRYCISFVIISIFISSLIIGSSHSLNISAKGRFTDNESTFQPNLLGEIDSSFETHVGFHNFDYLDGFIYGVDGMTNNLYVYNANTGISTYNISIPIQPMGITTDGTYLYMSVFSFSPPNGTIVKFDTSGTEISRFHIPIFDGTLQGLTWDGEYLWAFQPTPSSLIRINPDNGLVIKNITISFMPFGLTYYLNRIWACNYISDSIVAIDPDTGIQVDRYSSPYHYDSGIANNGTHFMQSRYIDVGDPYEVSFSLLPQEPGDLFTRSYQLLSPVMDLALDGEYYYYSENNTHYIYPVEVGTYSMPGALNMPFYPVGLTIIYDNFLLVSSEDAPYNLYTIALDGTVLVNHTGIGVMIRSLAFDGSNVWAMGLDGILYKLNPSDMSIITQFNVGTYFGITYDFDNEVLWLISKSDHKLKYIDPETGEFGSTEIDIQTPISPNEYGVVYDGEFFDISTGSDGGYIYRVLAVTLPEEPPINTTTPIGGLFPGIPTLYEDLIFLGIGIVSTSIIAIIIALIRKSKK